MSKKLSIIVAGGTNSGKSTMMLLIEKMLKENNFDVELAFEHHPDYSGENSFFFHQREEKDFNEKIEKIKKDTTITLQESQIYFDSASKKDKLKNPYC